jgi:mycothiol synthase
MRAVEIIRRPSTAERGELVEFVTACTSEAGSRPLSDHLWLDLTAGDGEGFLAVRARDETGTLALAQVSAAHRSSSLELVAGPAGSDRRAVLADVAETAVDSFRRRNAGTLFWWVDEPDADDHALADRLGLAPSRLLYEMRRPLPTREHATIETRAFVPGDDEDAWIDVNNRAFAGHGEQGGWTRDQLARRMREPWFDPAGFRIHERSGRIVAFCWTKLHRDHQPVLGEIYVIAVDPDFHGQGLGRQLTLAGLDSIAARDITVANLFVDAANPAAVSLYERLGFTIHHRRQAFAGTF